MKNYKLLLLLFIVFISPALAEPNPLLGKWQFVKLADGTKCPDNIKEVWTFSANKQLKVVEEVSGGVLAYKGFSVNTTVTPHQIDFIVIDVRTSKEKVFLGIFKVEKGKLHIASTNKADKKRPTRFTNANTWIYHKVDKKN